MNIDSQKLRASLNSIFSIGRRGGRTGSIGLTFSSESMQMMQMEDKGSGPVIRAAASVDYPCPRDELLADPANLRHFIQKTLRAGGFVGKKVITCLMPKDVRHIPVQYRQPDKNSNSFEPLFKELQNRVQEPLSSLVIDVLHVRTQTGDAADRSVIAVVAGRDRTIAHLELLRMAGLDVIAVDTGPAALGRLISDAHYGHQGGSSNGLKFSEGGEITSRVCLEQAMGDDFLVRFEVIDQGIGIPDDQRARIFDSFTQVDDSSTRKIGGIGIGLAICRHLATMMQAEIGVESVEGSGSRFWITVSLHADMAHPAERRDAAAASIQRPPESSGATSASRQVLAAPAELEHLLEELFSYLAKDDFQSIALWEASEALLSPLLGKNLSKFKQALEQFAFEDAHRLLNAAVHE